MSDPSQHLMEFPMATPISGFATNPGGVALKVWSLKIAWLIITFSHLQWMHTPIFIHVVTSGAPSLA